MEFQITEAIEIVKALAETENLTHTEALTAFFYEADLSIDDAAELKAYFFEAYTLQEMAVDSLSTALTNVFVKGINEESEELSEVDTKETQEGTKYKVRVKDRASNSSYVRYATREKVAELRANPNIASVEMTDHGTTGEDDRGERTAAAKTGRDYDGDGKPESSSKEHAGVVHNAIQRKMGGKPDGQDTRREEFEHIEENRRAARAAGGYKDDSKKQTDPSKAGFTGISGSIKDIMRQNKEIEASNKKKTKKEEFELEEGKKEADLGKMKRQSNKHMKDAVGKRTKSDSDSKNKSFKMDGIRRSIERGEDPRRDTYGGKRTGKDGTHSPEDHRSNFSYNMKDRPAKEPGVKKKVEEAADFNGSAPMDTEWCEKQRKRDEKSPSSKDRRHARGKFRPGASKEERAEGGRDAMREKGTSPKKNGKKMYEAYLQLRENRRAARAAGGYKDDSKKQTDPSKAGFTGISNSIADIMKQNKEIEAKNKKKKVAEEWKPDPTKKREAKAAKLGREEDIEKGKSKKYGRDEDKIKDLYKRRMAVDFKKKKSDIGEDFVTEGDLVNAGSENQGERDKKKLTGKGVDNKSSIKLMPVIDESIVTEHESKANKRLFGSSVNETLRSKIQEMSSKDEEMCDEIEKEEPKKKKKAKIDESGMPILEYSRNNATGPTKEMIDPEKDPEGEPGVMNPKGKPKRYKNAGEAPGDRRPNAPGGPELPFDKGTVPNGSGV